MAEYNLNYTGKELDDSINKFIGGFIDKTKISHFATGTVKVLTAGQKMTVTGIKDAATDETFTPKGVLAYIHVTSNSWLYPANHATGKPAVFCFIRDFDRGFGVGMACGTNGEKMEVRFNSDIGGVSSPSNNYITVDNGNFSYISITNSMYGLMAAPIWRWVAWG